MKALTLEAYNKLIYGDAPDPELSHGDVMIRVQACGICGSDIHGMDGSSGRRIPPIIMGHEASGVITQVAEGVAGWHEGDRVTFDSTIYCGHCDYCTSGNVNLCNNRRVLGVSPGDYRQHGAFAQLVCVPSHILHKLPENLSYEEAAFVEPVSIALHAANRLPVQAGDSAVVVGAGMIGLLAIQALVTKGVKRIIAVDIDPGKLEFARTMGATEGVLSNEDAIQSVHKLTGQGADLAMEVVGINDTLNLAIGTLRKGGSLALVGNLAAKTHFPLQEVVTRELTLYGSCSSSGEYPEALQRIADGSINVKPLISKIAPLAEGAEWFQRLYSGEKNLLKVILKPD
ncbi:MAG: galactitol-1-phosphate 5-dehydrogenase [Verrucomicrobiales bacterium]|nr:galactitol-1-phosphate 5-dehydrogenase [Verrucomicrobiales bacterium]